jgi:ankyrin repeat domain-containing protein 50
LSIPDHSVETRLAYFFFTFSDKEKQQVSQMLATVSAQLLRYLSEIPDTLKSIYKNNRTIPASNRTLTEFLKALVRSLGKVSIVLDALDEVAAADRSSLLDILQQFSTSEFGSLSALVTSRKEYYIQERLDKIGITQVSIQSALVDGDIASYVASRLKEDPKLKKWPQSCREEIEHTLVNGSHGM